MTLEQVTVRPHIILKTETIIPYELFLWSRIFELLLVHNVCLFS